MKRYGMVFLTVLTALCLCACSGKDDGAQAELDALRQENEALTAERDALAQQAEELTTQLTAQAEAAARETGEDNPIDAFFDAAPSGETTIEMHAVASLHADYWRAEVYHLAEEIKENLYLDEDRATVDAYLAAMEEQIGRMEAMTLFVCGDLQTPPADRIMFAGTIRKILWGSNFARIYRDTFYQLLNVHPGTYWEGGYEFAFDAAAAQTKLDDILAQK